MKGSVQNAVAKAVPQASEAAPDAVSVGPGHLEATKDGGCEFMVPESWRHSVSQALLALFEKEQLCDVTIKVGAKRIPCHRVVLASAVPYFRDMFLSDMLETRQGEVSLQDQQLEEGAVEAIVRFAYEGRARLAPDGVQALLYAACILQVEVLVGACSTYMQRNLDASNCLGVRAFAEMHNLKKLMSAADDFTRENFGAVAVAEEFLDVSPSHLVALLSSCDLSVVGEVQVYEATMRWLRRNSQHHERWLPTIAEQVRFPLLPLDFLMRTAFREELLKRNIRCRDLLDEAKNFHLHMQHQDELTEFEFSVRTTPRKSAAGVLFCVGGRGSMGDPFRSIECYDLQTGSWFLAAEMNSRRRHVGVISVGGKVYAVGGHDGNEHLTSMEMFDPLTNKWIPRASMNTKRRGIALAALASGPIYAIGGLDDSACFQTVERYDVAADSWSTVHCMNLPRGGVGAVALGRYIYAVGGNNGQTSLATVERYDPPLDKWEEVKGMKQRRAGAGVTVLNRCLYVVGGFDDNAPLNSVEKYDPQKDRWEEVADLTTPRGGVGVATLIGKIFAVGGHNGSTYLNTVEAYDPLTNKWEAVGSISQCRAGAGVAICACSIKQIREVAQGTGGVADCM
ncbi:kelch-like protein 8 [Lethenteron reissneri]|uniref:kelch-like protein 8 n=1 Tax=Lethenteron reissneri TaxID=7753 RepID=UPI002AB6320E|nr:kelch-like protein 8 [Lethenteron reissneri]